MKILSHKPTITRKELEGVLDCMINDELSSGNSVKTFEASIAQITGLKYSLALSSLTAAYHLIFKALELKPGDSVIMPSYFDQAPLSAALLTGATPLLVDVEENSFMPSLESITSAMNDSVKAVVIGHQFGFHFDDQGIYELKVPVIEDISHAFGTEVNEAPAGQRGAFAVAGFSPSMIITTGSGAAVTTNNSKYYSVMRDLKGGSGETINYEYSMNELQGAMGITQIMKLKDFLKRRREIAKIYYDAVKTTTHRPAAPYGDQFAYQSFPLFFDSTGDKTEKFWKKAGIEIVNPVQKPLHSYLNLRGLDYPNSDRMARKLFSLPIYPTLSKKDIERIARTLSSFI
jgi:dTDP-4-amino-4,6-dideoxygalactose transaminase